MTSSNLAVPHVVAAQAQKKVTVNAAVDLLDRAVTDFLAINGLGAAPIRKGDGTVGLDAGDLTASALVTVVHDGTVFRLA